MNIGVSTVYDANNCGAFLQAYALKTVLEKYGNNVLHIKYRTKVERKHECFEKKRISTFQYIKRHFGYSLKNYINYEKAIKEFKEIMPDDTKQLDMLIYGSDEIWNVCNDNIIDNLDKMKYECKHKVAYAVSSGNATFDDMQEFPQLIEVVKDMEFIYARDLFTKKNVELILGTKVETVCDPTLLLDISEYPSHKYKKYNKKYLLYYGYGADEKTKEYTRKYAKKYGLKIIAVGIKNNWCEDSVVCHPLDFIQYIKDAEVIVTPSFHGTIFSTLLNKRMVCINYDSKKLIDLVERIGLTDRVVSLTDSYEKFERILNSQLDFEVLSNNIMNIRKKSLIQLENMLARIEEV